jgi:hypothetical protein
MNLDPTLDPQEYRMELFLRSLAPPAARDAQEAIVDRLIRLDDQNYIRDYDLTIWGDRICLDVEPRTPTERAVRDKIDRIRQWERRHDVSLSPGFAERVVEPFVGDSYPVFQMPVVALAVYAGTDVWGIFPCEVDGDVVTVDECLDAFLRRRSLVEPQSAD